MILNTVAGFIIPWIFTVYILRKRIDIIILIAPISSVIAFTVNEIGFTFDFWRIIPKGLGSFSRLPIDIGLFALLPCLLVYTLERIEKYHTLIFLCYVIGITVCEFIGYIAKYVVYYNGWNIGYTFLSYLLPYCLVILYYKLLNSRGYL